MRAKQISSAQVPFTNADEIQWTTHVFQRGRSGCTGEIAVLGALSGEAEPAKLYRSRGNCQGLLGVGANAP